MHSLQHWENAFITYLHKHYKSDDAAHDLKHFNRVWKTSQYINNAEGNVADSLVLLAGSYFHDFVTVPKNSPDRSKASKFSADKAVEILQNDFFDEYRNRHAIGREQCKLFERVCYEIEKRN
jgi:uncharacterized protein